MAEQSNPGESSTRRRRRPGDLTQEKIAEINLQLRTMELMFELVQVANDMVRRGEAATIVQGLGSIMGAVAAERPNIVQTIREIKAAAE